MNILVVDDKEENRYLLEALLRGNGYAVHSAANGAEALEKLKSGGFDLIISDVLMPVMDGFQLCRKVKTDETLRHIPFIVYTATYTGPQDEEFAIKIGADRFIVKPCEPDVFMEAVRDVMAAVRRSDIALTPPPREEEVLKLYNERLVRKLEQKMLQLEKEVQARQKAEDFLQANERKYRLLADNTLDVIWTMNLDLVLTYVNPAIRSLTGHSPEEWIGSRLPEHCDEENFAKMVKVIANETAKGPEGAGVNLEAVILKKNKEPIPVEIHGRVVFDENGAPIFLMGTMQDISERKRSEMMLRESEEKYKSILDNIEDGYYEVDLAGNFTFFNRSLCRILGYSSSELMGMNNRQYTDKENARKVFQTFNRVFTTGEPFQAVDWEFIKKDGTICHINSSVSLIRDGNGNATGFRGLTRDVTERRNAEKEKNRLTEQLYQAQKMESVGRVAGGVAHDFNNLLTIILGYGEIVLQALSKDHPLCDPLELVYQAGVRAKDLTRQLLAFSRKQVLEMSAVDVSNVVIEFEKLLHRLIGEDIQLNLSLTSEPLTVSADITQLEQVLMNLAVNARDAMPDGGTLTIETAGVELDAAYAESKPEVTPGKYAMICVSDTGCGMDKEILSQIFEPFFTTKGKDKGTGLGLATSYGIIRQHGGNIWVYSEVNYGTTFKIYLPVCEKADVFRETASPAPDNLQGSETILLVEDNEQVRNLTKTILKKQGYIVLTAENGDTALAALDSHVGPLTLLLTDVIMPGMNGRDLFGRISGRYPKLKVLYMSGYTDDVIAHRGVLDDGLNFIQKPFSVKALAAKVRKVIDEE